VTVLTLFYYINIALLAQLVLGVTYVLVTRKKSPDITPFAPAAPAALPQNSAWSGLREFRVSKREFEDRAQTQCSFYLEPLDGQPLPDFKPGQFLTFQLAVPAVSDGSVSAVTRCYSLSDGPTPAHYRVTIKRAAAPVVDVTQLALPHGVASGYFHDQVQVGSTLQLRAPSGHFYLQS
jgi:ferredoxin-NADP reductase